MRLTRLKLTNWKNFKNAEVRLASRAIFLGPNASGKSNLLDAVRFLRDIVTPSGGLGAAVERRGGVSALRCLHATRNSDIEVEADVGTDEEPAVFSYTLRFNAKKDEAPSVRRERVTHSGKVIRSRPDSDDNSDELLLTQTHLQQVNQNQKFRGLAEFLGQIQYLHVVPQIVRDRRRSVSGEPDPYGGDFLARVKATPKRARDSLLKKINSGLRVAVPQFDGLTYDDDAEGRPHLYAKYHHWRPHPAGQSEEVFSDGTLRLIGFLWALGEKQAGPLLLEEPELSLHDAIVEQLPALIVQMQSRSHRQVLLTTHSQALLNERGIGLHEVHMLIPTVDGSQIVTVGDNARIRRLVEGGLQVGEAAMPEVRPERLEQLSLFDAHSD